MIKLQERWLSMLKYLFLLLFLATLSNAQENSQKNVSDKVEIYASTMDSKGDIVEASGGVTVVYEDYFISAKRAIYNRETGELELFDNIRANYKGTSKILGKYARLNIKKKEKMFKPFYMLDKDSKVWMSADEGQLVDNELDINSGTVSGCNPMNPLWTMDFSSSDYDTDSKWLNLYNMRLYIHDIPVFYTPYFGYSLDTTRRTGLLMPSLGLSQEEGFYYSQPIYIAEQNWWDLELTPQIRANRGSGIYSKFRFVDSPYSYGELKLGYFKEKEAYYEKYKRPTATGFSNDSFYGYNFLYDNKDVINQWFSTDLEGQSGLYVDLNFMNDVEYINLAGNNAVDNVTSNQVLSRINLFYNTDKHYFGTYLKYYQNLDLETDDDTIQQLPVVQYHYYLETLLEDHLLYSADVKSTNLTRKINKKVNQTDINIPVALQTALFDEYLNLSYQASLYGQYSQFSGEEETPVEGEHYDNGYFLRNTHVLSASTQITKAFEEYTHVLGLGVSYTKSSGSRATGYYEGKQDYCSNVDNKSDPEYNNKCEFYQISDVEDVTKLDLIQYLYNDDAEQIVYHRLSQAVYYGANAEQKYGKLENELDLAITKALHYYNNMFYSFHKHLFSKAINKISYRDYGVNFSVSHLYRDNFKESYVDRSERYTSYLTTRVGYDYSKHYYFSASYAYDIELKIVKTKEFGILYKKRCWDFGLKYLENNRPISGADPIRDRYIMLNIVLKPFMKSNPNNSLFEFKLPEQQ